MDKLGSLHYSNLIVVHKRLAGKLELLVQTSVEIVEIFRARLSLSRTSFCYATILQCRVVVLKLIRNGVQ